VGETKKKGFLEEFYGYQTEKLIMITHQDIKKHFLETQKAEGKAEGSIKNIESTYNVYLATMGISVYDKASDFDRFNISLEKFKKIKGYPKKTWEVKKSHLLLINRAYLRLKNTICLPDGFGERLQYLMDFSDMEFQEIEKSAGLKKDTTYAWRKNGLNPRAKYIPNIHKIEEILDVDRGVLTGQLNGELYGTKAAALKNKKSSEHGIFVNLARNEPYALHKWNEEAEKQWDHMEAYFRSPMSKSYLKLPGMTRRKVIKRNPKAHWKKDSTRDLKRWFCNSFFGFLVLPKDSKNPRLRGLGYSQDQISLALLTDPDLIQKYLDFKKERTKWGQEYFADGSTKIVRLKKEGVYSNELYKFIEFIITLTLVKTGYLRQRPDLKKFVDTEGLDWNTWIENTIESVVDLKNTEGLFVKNRTGHDKIGFILGDPDPMRWMKILVDGLKSRTLTNPEDNVIRMIDKACFLDYLMCSLFIANPLRVEMYHKMKLGKNINKDDDGLYYIKFQPEDFKNVEGAAKDKVYREPVPEWAGEIIDIYMEYYRPHCVGGKKDPITGTYECDYFYRPIKSDPRSPKDSPVAISTFRNRVTSATLLILPQTGSGFGPHAFRHIIATGYLKKHPGQYIHVAGILHDTLETVLKNYKHLESADHYRAYNSYTDTIFCEDAEQRKNSKSSKELASANEKIDQLIDMLKQEKESAIVQQEMLMEKITEEKALAQKEIQRLKDSQSKKNKENLNSEILSRIERLEANSQNAEIN
jgi:hypothetical protein